jgi:NADH-quinone oxidoreductase subunit G
MADPVQPAPAAAPAAPAAPELPPAGPGEVALVVDGQPVVVPKGTTVLQAAERIGIVVPHYCYHPGLSVAGNCRMCLVEIEKTPKLQIGCATTATQGMIVRTTTPRVKTTRQGIMEFLLINHPLDCPICDQAGECRLQQYSAEYGTGESRFVEEKIHNEKRYAIGARVTFDGERCIKCTRCIRFCDEVSKTGELGLFERGGHAIIGAFPGRPLDNAYSGNTVDICPVGALTWRPFRFRARVWFLKDTPSVCAGCARGCNVNLATYDGRIHRITPRLNEEVNSYWMCDFGRQSHEPLYARPRLERSLVRQAQAPAAGAPAGPATASEALDRAAGLLRAVTSRFGADAIAAIVSARLTLEDLYLAKTVLGGLVGAKPLVVPPHEEGADDDLLIRKDRTPNARGAALLGLGADAQSLARLSGDIQSGRVRGLVVVGEDPLGDGLLKEETLLSLEALVVVDSWKSPTIQAAHAALPAAGYGEYDGVYVSFLGRAQRARQAVRPHGFADPPWAVLRELGRRFGLSQAYARASDLFDEMAAQVPALAGLSYRSLGEGGQPIAGA